MENDVKLDSKIAFIAFSSVGIFAIQIDQEVLQKLIRFEKMDTVVLSNFLKIFFSTRFIVGLVSSKVIV
ncbi:hypothetical protein T4B_8417 [Trichinella pseudospiralis]|uniref:Uncharacterized protein n=1 Tax=Trichinella pseudospiralis TaxID=6337 RepID=A0A0V1ISG2_TRIPS|nr:hypothetical protein T4B_8417 [Trichinella pseudospiralis]